MINDEALGVLFWGEASVLTQIVEKVSKELIRFIALQEIVWIDQTTRICEEYPFLCKRRSRPGGHTRQ